MCAASIAATVRRFGGSVLRHFLPFEVASFAARASAGPCTCSSTRACDCSCADCVSGRHGVPADRNCNSRIANAPHESTPHVVHVGEGALVMAPCGAVCVASEGGVVAEPFRSGGPFLAQANMDHWVTESEDDSVERMRVARRVLRAIVAGALRSGVTSSGCGGGDGGARQRRLRAFARLSGRKRQRTESPMPAGTACTPAGGEGPPPAAPVAELWALLGRYPILDDETIYGSVMDPRSGHLETRLPIRRRGRAARF